ncbi:MAG: LysR family transcriptional regulator [Alphaproteobacteria bacterium]|jgi:LysR family transcriptional regulator, carnitine catabolism transcriptional activator|nr:LysR family transcriptional regulator [Alphaproteobacteria bacterium]
MDLDQLRTFDRIVREQSFTRAAAHLNITQATASMRIRALEQLLGVTLFQRGRTVTLTDQGMTFLPFARRIIGTAQEAREALRLAERGRVAIASLRTLVSPLITESLLRFQEKYPHVDVVVNEGRQSQIVSMLHERNVEMGILCWPNLDPLVVDLLPLVVMRERVPLVVSPEIAAQLSRQPEIEEVLALVPRVISLRWWQAEPEQAAALARMAQTSVDLPTGPARRLAMKGQGLGFFVQSAVAEDVAAGRLVEIAPTHFEPLHRDTAMVVRSTAALKREVLADFVSEIARECANVGIIIENRLEEILGQA